MLQQHIFDRQRGGDALAQARLVVEIGNLHANLLHLVGIERRNALLGRAELFPGQPFFLHFIEQTVVGKDDLGAFGYAQSRRRHSPFCQRTNFL